MHIGTSFYSNEELKKFKFASIGENVLIKKNVCLYFTGNISIENNVRIDDNVIIVASNKNTPVKILNSEKPEIVNIIIDPNQKIIPKLQFGNPIEDLSPLLSRKELKKNMIIELLNNKVKNFTEAN